MATEAPIAQAFFLICERFSREHGIPLPKKLLSTGSDGNGWGVQLNLTDQTIDHIPPCNAYVTWNGWPTGIITPYGGGIAAGDLANEATLCEWLQSDLS